MQQYRAQLAGLDGELLDRLNQRVRLVQQIKAYKDTQGLAFHDPAQEERLLANLCQGNPGPLSPEGLRAIFSLILAWAKRDAV